MADTNPLFDVRRYTLIIIISFVAMVIFTLCIMQWHGSYEKDANGNVHYNTRVNEPSTSY